MKKIWKKVLVVLSILCLSIIALGITKNIESQYTIDIPYEYPIVPGTQEWIELEDVVDRREACQIPDDILNHMTTDALLETVINYPFRSDMYSFNDFQTGYETVKRRFNGLQELERRSDCLDALLRYSQVSYSSSDAEAEWEHHIAGSLYYAISGEQDFLISPYATSSTIYTPKGTPVPVVVGQQYSDLPSQWECSNVQAMKQKLQDDKKAFPRATLLRGTEYPNLPSYNCYSYALYSQSTDNNIWMNYSFQYFTDGSYQKVIYPYKNAMVGDVFVYGLNERDEIVCGATHLALVESIIIPEQGVKQVISKWGCGGLWSHKPNDCPYWEEVGEYWSVYRLAFS